MSEFLFTSESVSEGHPDKVADAISDAALDAILAQDKYGRVAAETLVHTGLVVMAGQVTTNAQVDYAQVARRVVQRIGYTDSDIGFDYKSCGVLVCYDQQSVDIAAGVDEGKGLDLDQGAGDQGLMYGFACDETPELMPMPIHYSHRLMERQAEMRRNGKLPWLRPDAKSQVTIKYVDGRPVGIDTVVISTQHTADVSHRQIEKFCIEQVIRKVLPKALVGSKTEYLINPTGRFVVGGPQGDCGLTGRKIIVDSYGGMGRHGGGAFSGKDPTKVDRSAAYMARWVAKHIVASGAAERCELQVAYAIGHPEPTSIHLDTFGTGAVADEVILAAVKKTFLFNPAEIIRQLDLRRPIYRASTHYGHFGKKGLPWETTSKLPAFVRAIKANVR